MTATFSLPYKSTQRDLVINIARIVYATHGCKLPSDPLYLWRSQHPTEQAVLYCAESIFEMFFGDSPDYIDDSEELMKNAEAIAP